MSDGRESRNADGTFSEGVSGNAGGRAKGHAELRKRARDVVDRHVIAAWEREIESQGEDWVKCSELVTAYGYGKPPAAPEDHEAAKEALRPLANASSAEILAALASKGDAGK